MIFENLKAALAKQFELDAEAITMDTNLIDDLGADSLDVVELIMELEDRFGPMPPAARRLVRLATLRTECAAAGIDRVDARGERAVFYREGSDKVAFVADLRKRDADGRIAEIAAAVRAARRDGEG